MIDVARELASHETTYRVHWDLSREHRDLVGSATADGKSSREIGLLIGKSGSYVRHVRSKLVDNGASDSRTAGASVEEGRIRFPNEHRPGVAAMIKLDAEMAELLGYYVAEGSVVRDRKRPNSYCLTFSFSHREMKLAERVRDLLRRLVGVEAQISWRATTLAVVIKKASAALLFQSLAGKGAAGKHVPAQLFTAAANVVESFVRAYVRGDGHQYANGKVSVTTVSTALAQGVAFLALKLGHLPSVYDCALSGPAIILGRSVNRCALVFGGVVRER